MRSYRSVLLAALAAVAALSIPSAHAQQSVGAARPTAQAGDHRRLRRQGMFTGAGRPPASRRSSRRATARRRRA